MPPDATLASPTRAAFALAATRLRRARLPLLAAVVVLAGCRGPAPTPHPLPPVQCVHQHNCEEYP